MARLIDADELKNEILDCYEYEFPTASGAFDEFVSMIIPRIINNAQTVDAVPVVQGRWIWHEDAEEFECSCCHDIFDYTHTYDLFDHGFQQANYCPNCGAIMDEE